MLARWARESVVHIFPAKIFCRYCIVKLLVQGTATGAKFCRFYLSNHNLFFTHLLMKWNILKFVLFHNDASSVQIPLHQTSKRNILQQMNIKLETFFPSHHSHRLRPMAHNKNKSETSWGRAKKLFKDSGEAERAAKSVWRNYVRKNNLR